MSHTYLLYVCRHTLSLSSHPFQTTVVFQSKTGAKVQPFSILAKYFFKKNRPPCGTRYESTLVAAKIFCHTPPRRPAKRHPAPPEPAKKAPFRSKKGLLGEKSIYLTVIQRNAAKQHYRFTNLAVRVPVAVPTRTMYTPAARPRRSRV